MAGHKQSHYYIEASYIDDYSNIFKLVEGALQLSEIEIRVTRLNNKILRKVKAGGISANMSKRRKQTKERYEKTVAEVNYPLTITNPPFTEEIIDLVKSEIPENTLIPDDPRRGEITPTLKIEIGADASTIHPTNANALPIYEMMQNFEQIKSLAQQSSRELVGLFAIYEKLAETKREKDEIQKSAEESKSRYEQQLNAEKSCSMQLKNSVSAYEQQLEDGQSQRRTLENELRSSSNKIEHLKSEIEKLQATVVDEKAKKEEMNEKLKEKDMDLKTQVSMFEGEVTNLKGQIVDLNLKTTQMRSEVEKSRFDILGFESQIQTLTTQREIQDKAKEETDKVIARVCIMGARGLNYF